MSYLYGNICRTITVLHCEETLMVLILLLYPNPNYRWQLKCVVLWWCYTVVSWASTQLLAKLNHRYVFPNPKTNSTTSTWFFKVIVVSIARTRKPLTKMYLVIGISFCFSFGFQKKVSYSTSKKATGTLTKISLLTAFVHRVFICRQTNAVSLHGVHIYIGWKDHTISVCGVVWYLRIE